MEKIIPINITHAEITAMGFIFNKETTLPEFSATVALISDGQQITSISIDSREYYGVLGKAEKTALLIELAAKTRNELTTIITRHMNAQRKILEHKEF